MNSSYKVTTWLYAVPTATGPLPPVGLWTSESSQGPKVSADNRMQHVLAEKDTRILLEDGQTLQNNSENKSCCWAESDKAPAEHDKENESRARA